MADKTEEQTARDRAAVDSMRNAKANMDSAINRIDTLERALGAARDDLLRMKGFIGGSAYTYPGGGDRRTVHDYIDEMAARATKALG